MSDKAIAHTPVMKQFLEIKEKYQDSILLFRMGDFYETFLDDAKITSKIFNGKSKIEQHKIVYRSLQGKMGNELHALSITTEGR